MALCINQSGTYRNITTLCINQSGTYRNITGGSGRINQSGTYRKFIGALEVGDSYEGGFLICKASPIRWVVSPYSAEISRTWYLRNDANTRAQQVSGCTGWFVPTRSQLQNPGAGCRSFWGPSPCHSGRYWSSIESDTNSAFWVDIPSGGANSDIGKSTTYCVRAFRCVSY
jgi:hypothetical protein